MPKLQENGKQLKGFALMTPKRRREVAAMGGRARRAAWVPAETDDFIRGFNKPSLWERLRRGLGK